MQSQIEVLSHTGCWFWCHVESVSVLQEVHVLWFNDIIWVWVCWSFQWLRCSVDSHKWLEIKCFGAVQETQLIPTSGWKSNVSKLFEYFMVLVNAWFVITLSCLITFHFHTLLLCHHANFWCLAISTHTWNYCQNPDMNKPEKNLKLASKVMCQGGFFHKIVNSDFKLFLVGIKKHGRAKRGLPFSYRKHWIFFPLLSFSFQFVFSLPTDPLPISVNRFLSFPSSIWECCSHFLLRACSVMMLLKDKEIFEM
jgi:hypothetical protein